MRATIVITTGFDSMANDPAAAMFTLRRKGMDCALEAIEVMRDAVDDDLYRFIVLVPTTFTLAHKDPLLFGWQSETAQERGLAGPLGRMERFRPSREACTIWSCSASSTPSSTNFSANVCSSGAATGGTFCPVVPGLGSQRSSSGI